MSGASAVEQWEGSGTFLDVLGHRIFVVDGRPGAEDAAPVLVLHGFPTCSFEWRHVLPALGHRRRVVLLDMLGYGLSAKPDRRYSLFHQADIVEACARALGLDTVALVTHDMGDSVGGELLAREVEGALSFAISDRVITNGSIYMDLVRLSPGQQLLLALPDVKLPEEQALGPEVLKPALAATFAPETQPDPEELDAQWILAARNGGNRLFPRLIRYVEERRVHEDRWTGAIEKHPSPLTIIWGTEDPIAVFAMAERLASRRSDATLEVLDRIGHYPMVEDPDRFSDAVRKALG